MTAILNMVIAPYLKRAPFYIACNGELARLQQRKSPVQNESGRGFNLKEGTIPI